MVTAVQAAVVAAAAAWVIGVGVAVRVMLKGARLMSETSTAVAGLRQRGDLLIERANAAIDRAGEQIARTETVTAGMAGLTATMSELDGQLTALAPAPTAAAGSAGAVRPASAAGPASGLLTWMAALLYGIRWAAGMRQAARPGTGRWAGPWPGGADRGAGRRAALTGRADGRPR